MVKKNIVVIFLVILNVWILVGLWIKISQINNDIKPKYVIISPQRPDLITDNPCEQDTIYAQRKGDTIRLEFHWWTKNK